MINYDGEYVIFICEGNFERAILDILLEHDCLVISANNLIGNPIIDRARSAKKIEVKYLNRRFDKPVRIIRLIDSKNEKFELSPAYSSKVNEINTCLTRRSIEILIIIAEDHYEKFTQSSIDSCEDYIEIYLGYKNYKSYDFVKNYFSDINKLINALKTYKKLKKQKELCIADLLKE